MENTELIEIEYDFINCSGEWETTTHWIYLETETETEN